MSKLVRLYPRAWRDRYEEEFLALLAERPPTFGDLLDTVRGALDAHLHPQADVEPSPWTHRIPGLFALTAGAMWSALVLAFVLWQDAAWGVAFLAPASLLLMFLSLLGDYVAAHGRRIALVLGVVGLCIVVANLPYSLITIVAGISGYLIVLGGMLTLAAIRAEIGPSGRWLVLVLAVVLPAATGFPLALGLGAISSDELWVLGLLLPYGLAWLLIGLRMAVRGSRTLSDLPTSPTEPEVHAA
ncbi:MAG TPA: hypothetical protein VGQ64_05200 [Candidatus Limnocylindrales bacterium]|jgi:hypothetical protein|nr:hypothetical protein [Candidatus Limnocylindrales bacterium]